jgi:hypothetical protein
MVWVGWRGIGGCYWVGVGEVKVLFGEERFC